LGLAHGGLEVERLDVLPVLLEERDQEVDREHGVGENVLGAHLDVSDGDTEAENLLKLELDGGSDFGDLVSEVLRVGDGGRELSGLGETGTEETRDLLDENLGSKESVVLLGELLDELLVLVELLQVLDRHVLELDKLGTIDVGSISENADGHARAGDVRKLDGSRETLVTLRVVVLETDLELDGLDEVTLLLARRLIDDGLDLVAHAANADLGGHCSVHSFARSATVLHVPPS